MLNNSLGASNPKDHDFNNSLAASNTKDCVFYSSLLRKIWLSPQKISGPLLGTVEYAFCKYNTPILSRIISRFFAFDALTILL